MNDPNDNRLLLRQLPVAPRLVMALFLLSAGLGYFSALVQLHFQGAAAGNHLPGPDETVATYHGHGGESQLERLLTSDESKPFNGSGSMRAAFTTRSGGWVRALKQKCKELNRDAKEPEALQQASAELCRERDGERKAVLAWIRRIPSGRNRTTMIALPCRRILPGKPSRPSTSPRTPRR